MFKAVIKEIGILLLILVAVTLLLIVLFYDYNPNNITVSKKVEEYSLPEDMQKELDKSLNLSSQEIIKTYQVGTEDLNRYIRQDEYNPGKVAPYALYSPSAQGNTAGEQTTGGGSSSGGSSGTFFNVVGK